MLLEDVFIIENLQVLNEGKNGTMKVRGIFQRADEENNNGRIYPKALLEREITKLNESMKGRRLMGELDHPQHDSVKLSNVSHLITKLEAKGNDIIGEAEILDTPMGKVAKALIEGGVQIGISSRGMGTLSEASDGKKYVNEDFRLITWDLVADPSTRGAFPTLAESTDLNSRLANEILESVLPKVTKQKVFSTILAERLDEALKGKQHKLDKNKNGRLDANDFEILRRKKKGRRDEMMGSVGASEEKTKRQRKHSLMGPTARKAAKQKMELSHTLFPRLGNILSETEEAQGSRTTKPRKGPTRTSKSKRDLSSAYMKGMKKMFKNRPDRARATEIDLRAARNPK